MPNSMIKLGFLHLALWVHYPPYVRQYMGPDCSWSLSIINLPWRVIKSKLDFPTVVGTSPLSSPTFAIRVPDHSRTESLVVAGPLSTPPSPTQVYYSTIRTLSSIYHKSKWVLNLSILVIPNSTINLANIWAPDHSRIESLFQPYYYYYYYYKVDQCP